MSQSYMFPFGRPTIECEPSAPQARLNWCDCVVFSPSPSLRTIRNKNYKQNCCNCKLVICLSFEPACSLAASLLAVQTDESQLSARQSPEGGSTAELPISGGDEDNFIPWT